MKTLAQLLTLEIKDNHIDALIILTSVDAILLNIFFVAS